MPEQTLIERVQTVREQLAAGTLTDEALVVLQQAMETERTSAATRQIEAQIDWAFAALSHSELGALELLLRQMPVNGLLVASQIADRAGVTRSVLVNAFRKMESAGVIATRSLGMKGTHVKFLGGLSARTLLDHILKRKRPAA